MLTAASALSLMVLCAPPAALPPAASPPASRPPAAPAPAAPTPAVPPSRDPESDLPRVLVFSKTTGFRHASIPVGVAAVRQLGAGLYAVDTTEDGAAFTQENLAKYKAVVFLSTTGDVLDADQQKAFEGYIRAGGGYAGIHAAADTEYDWPWYGQLMGAFFKGHTAIQPASMKVEDRSHRSTRMLPERWTRTEEWYSFRTNPRERVTVLASLDESTYTPGELAMGDHPVAWCHQFDGGRAWYTACGHSAESFSEPLFRQHMQQGIAWAAGLPDKGAQATEPALPVAPPATPPSKAGILALAPPVIAQMTTAIWLGVAMIAAAIVLGRMGQGVRAPILAWILPGLGHFSLGYRKRGVLAMAGVMGLLVTGLLVGGADAVDSVEDAPWFIAQAGNGPVAFGIDALNQGVLKTGKIGELIPAPPNGRTTVSSYKGLGAANEYGTLLIALGGLMNMVLMMDCARRDPAVRPTD